MSDATRSMSGSAGLRPRLAEVEIVSVRREPLSAMTDADVRREGVPPEVFGAVRGSAVGVWFNWVEWFAATMHCGFDAEVTRIEWRYLD